MHLLVIVIIIKCLHKYSRVERLCLFWLPVNICDNNCEPTCFNLIWQTSWFLMTRFICILVWNMHCVYNTWLQPKATFGLWTFFIVSTLQWPSLLAMNESAHIFVYMLHRLCDWVSSAVVGGMNSISWCDTYMQFPHIWIANCMVKCTVRLATLSSNQLVWWNRTFSAYFKCPTGSGTCTLIRIVSVGLTEFIVTSV